MDILKQITSMRQTTGLLLTCRARKDGGVPAQTVPARSHCSAGPGQPRAPTENVFAHPTVCRRSSRLPFGLACEALDALRLIWRVVVVPHPYAPGPCCRPRIFDALRISIAVFLTAAVVAAVPPAVAQISPGELAAPHAFLEGIKKCLKCHDLGEGPSTKKCLDCHQEIAAGVNNKRGYHHRTVNLQKKECFDCHSEHAGRDFRLVHWPNGINSFDHKLTGYDLDGKHAGLKCRECHKSDLIQEDLSRFGDQVDRSRTFLGLHTACLDCHPNEHRGQLSDNCLGCHTNEGWKPPSGFDHEKAAYQLVGKHETLSCAACHPTIDTRDPAWPGSESFVRYTGLSYTNCAPCHKDVHQGNYGTVCANCHNISGWHDVPESKFDHAKTRFPLLGLHAGLACTKCHAPKKKKAPLAHERCTDCHLDIHRGQFIRRSDEGACESCHTVGGFVPSLFTATDHSSTRFALEGAHLAQPCVACHPVEQSSDGTPYRLFIMDDTRCIVCHKDIHFGQFGNKNCTACHDVREWQRIAFNHDRDSNYRLEGEHRHVRCSGCHVEITEAGHTFVRYKPIDPACATCHTIEGLELGQD